jgi:acyl-coenzyme A thioesterase PaaI-like protein
MLQQWDRLSKLPMGKRAFSRMVGCAAPYTGSMGARVVELAPGRARVGLRDRRRVRNHLKSVHAVALMNLGEMATGLATLTALPDGGRGILTELSMSYTKKARGTITARAETAPPHQPGDHDHRVEGVLTDESGDEVARVSAVWRLEIPAIR